MEVLGQGLARLESVSECRQVHRYEDLVLTKEAVIAAGMTIRSRGLLKNLRGCTQICLMAVTIGVGADRLTARAKITDMTEAAIFQAAGAAMVEAWCDEVNKQIIAEAAKKGMFCRPRFSPGYGDFPLEFQRNFEALLDMPRTIGVSLTDTCLMVPSKSVTAVIGLSPEAGTDCILQGCEACGSADSCVYRRY